MKNSLLPASLITAAMLSLQGCGPGMAEPKSVRTTVKYNAELEKCLQNPPMPNMTQEQCESMAVVYGMPKGGI